MNKYERRVYHSLLENTGIKIVNSIKIIQIFCDSGSEYLLHVLALALAQSFALIVYFVLNYCDK